MATYVVDLTHMEGIEDPDRSIPGPARRLGVYFCAITEQASTGEPGAVLQTDIACRRRPGRKPCRGRIQARRDGSPSVIRWWCPKCRDNGFIHNWVGSRWDRSMAATDETAAHGSASVSRDVALVRGILARLDEAQDRIFLDPEEHGVIVRAVVDAAVEHVGRRGLDADAAGAVRELLIAHARRLYVRRWLVTVREDATEMGVVIDEAKEIEAAEKEFDTAIAQSGSGILPLLALLRTSNIVH
jgi:hypothetical protein